MAEREDRYPKTDRAVRTKSRRGTEANKKTALPMLSLHLLLANGGWVTLGHAASGDPPELRLSPTSAR